MSKLKTLGSRIAPVKQERVAVLTTATNRMTGRRLQKRRLDMWQANPTCTKCGRVVDHPRGYELDHLVPLWQGGEDVEGNCQILCIWYDDKGDKQGCHIDKTAVEAKSF